MDREKHFGKISGLHPNWERDMVLLSNPRLRDVWVLAAIARGDHRDTLGDCRPVRPENGERGNDAGGSCLGQLTATTILTLHIHGLRRNLARC